MKSRIFSVVSALLVAVLLFTCMAPAVIGETNYQENPDQTDGEDEVFVSEDDLATYGIGISSIVSFVVASGIASYIGYTSMAAAAAEAGTAITAGKVAGVIFRGVGIGSFVAMAVVALGYGIWSWTH